MEIKRLKSDCLTKFQYYGGIENTIGHIKWKPIEGNNNSRYQMWQLSLIVARIFIVGLLLVTIST